MMKGTSDEPMIDGFEKYLVIAFLIITALGIIFEAVVVGVAYHNADKVECNWLGCTFTETKGNATISQDCFMNGIRVNCSKTELMRFIK